MRAAARFAVRTDLRGTLRATVRRLDAFAFRRGTARLRDFAVFFAAARRLAGRFTGFPAFIACTVNTSSRRCVISWSAPSARTVRAEGALPDITQRLLDVLTAPQKKVAKPGKRPAKRRAAAKKTAKPRSRSVPRRKAKAAKRRPAARKAPRKVVRTAKRVAARKAKRPARSARGRSKRR